MTGLRTFKNIPFALVYIAFFYRSQAILIRPMSIIFCPKRNLILFLSIVFIYSRLLTLIMNSFPINVGVKWNISWLFYFFCLFNQYFQLVVWLKYSLKYLKRCWFLFKGYSLQNWDFGTYWKTYQRTLWQR